MEEITTELLQRLRPLLKNKAKAQSILDRYWQNKIALLWTTKDVHRAANEKETVLTEAEARELLSDLLEHYNPQYGLRWSDVTEAVEESGKGRDITRKELDQFIQQNLVSVAGRNRP